MEQLDYNLLFRWVVGLSMDDAEWNYSAISKDRDRLLVGDITSELFSKVFALTIEPRIACGW